MGNYIRKFNIPTYAGGTSYSKYDVVKAVNSNQEYYFVSIHDFNVGNLNVSTMASSSHWKRFDDPANDFADIWTPTYQTNAAIEPRVINSVLEEGVSLITRDGINTTPLKFQLSFENVSDKEAFSLVCFCDFIGSGRTFFWTTPVPYTKRLGFKLDGVQHSYTKKNINNISMNIESSYVILGVGAGQTKFGDF